MDVAEYRKKYKEELERQAQNKISYREYLNRLRAPVEESVALNMPDEPPSPVGLPNEDDVQESINIIRNKAEATHVRSQALRGITTEIGKREDLIDMTLELLLDVSESTELRRTALGVLRVLSFSSPLWSAKRPEYFAALRMLIDDQDKELREQAISVLAQKKDEYVQRRLFEGLQDSAKALVPPETALQLLAYDVHAEYFPVAREIVNNPPSVAAKDQALRLLAADATSKDLMTEILRDKSENPKIRRTSAVALQSLAPEEFRGHAREIALDENENEELRAASITSLDHLEESVFLESIDPAAAMGDHELDQRIASLKENATSEDLRHAAARYTQRRGVREKAAPTSEVRPEAEPEPVPQPSQNPFKIAVDVIRSFIKGLRTPTKRGR